MLYMLSELDLWQFGPNITSTPGSLE